MFLKEFNQTSKKKINKLTKLLGEEFGIKIRSKVLSQGQLNKLKETAEMAVIRLRNSNKKFQLDPEYAKFLGLRDLTETMLNEGMYAESPAYESMCNEMRQTVRKLMDSGYSMDEACGECMNRYRMDPRWAYNDEFVMPIVLKAAKDYMQECGMNKTAIEDAVMEMPETDLNERLLRELAAECGVELSSTGSIDAIEEKLATFASVSGKSRDAVVGFLNGLEEDAIQGGIQMFGRKIAEQNAYNMAAAAASKEGKKEFEFPKGSGKMHPVKISKDAAEKMVSEASSSMFDDIINDLLKEDVDVEQAEVVMAVRSLSSDIQDQIERIGRMMNEDIPAIADQMRSEMGASQAQSFTDSMYGILNSHLEATRQVKDSIDNSVGQLTGEEMAGGLGDTAIDAEPEPSLGLGDEEPVDNLPAMAGPEEEPLGRAEL